MRHFDISRGPEMSLVQTTVCPITQDWSVLCLGYKCDFASSSLSNQDKNRMQAMGLYHSDILPRILFSIETPFPGKNIRNFSKTSLIKSLSKNL